MSEKGSAARPAKPPSKKVDDVTSAAEKLSLGTGIAQPSTFLKPQGLAARSIQNFTSPSPSASDRDQQRGLKAMRDFLRIRMSYDVLPLSFRMVMLSTDLLVKRSLNILLQNNIVSAPLWDQRTSSFAGLLTTSDYMNIIQYYWQNPDAFAQIDQFRLSSLRDVERAIGVSPIEKLSIKPTRPLYEACIRMLETRARRIPLVDVDDESGRETVVSVITQYRILKFIAVNNPQETELLRKTVREIGLGTYKNVQAVSIDTPVIDVIHMMVKHNISSVPIVDEDNRVLNVFEAVDVIAVIGEGNYSELSLSVGDALAKRADDFPGIYTCTEEDRLDTIFDTIRKSRVHRFVVIDDAQLLRGVISLSDILKYVLLHGQNHD